MGERNSVSVIIFGQEYNFASDMPREYVMKLADKVDVAMRNLGDGANQSLSKTAVLAAMLIADEYFRRDEDCQSLLLDNERFESKAANFEKLWNEAKLSLASSKEEQEAVIKRLQDKIAEQNELITGFKEVPDEVQNHITELEKKCRDIESSFFDIQMENIRLKNELDQLKRNY